MPALSANMPDSIKGVTLQGVEVTPKRAIDPIKTTTQTQSIDAQEIKLRGITDISDAMRRFAGVNLRDYGGAGGMKTVSLRGFGAQHTGVVYDGIALSNLQNGEIDLSRYNLDNLNSVSLNTGENDEIFLPARASASASTLILSSYTDKDLYDPSLRMRVALEAGSFNHWRPSAYIGKSFSEKVALSASGSFLHSDNDYPYTLANGNTTMHERRRNSRINNGNGDLSCFWQCAPGGSLTIKGYVYGNDQQLPGPAILYNPENNEYLRELNTFGQATYRQRLAPKWRLMINAKYNWASTRYENHSDIYPNGLLRNRYIQQEYYGSAALLFSPISGLQFDYSADYAHNKFRNGAALYMRNSLLQSLAAKYTVWRLKIIAKALYSLYMHPATGVSDAGTHQRLSPSLGLLMQPIPSEEFFVRASYKEIFRMPTFSELYFDHYGSINLDPELTRQYNLGVTWQRSSMGFLDQLGITLDGYINEVRNKIVAMPVGMFMMRMMNLGKVRIFGADATLQCDFRLAQSHMLLLNATYSYTRAQPRTDRTMLDWMKQLAYTPLNSGSASLTWTNPWVNVTAHVTGCSGRYSTNHNLPSSRIPGYMELGFTLSHDFHFRGHVLELRADLINALDKQYELVARYPMPGRAWSASVVFKL